MQVTNQNFNIPGYGSISQLPKDAANFAERLLTSAALPGEQKVQFVVRRIFEVIGSIFILLPLLPALPFLFIGYAVHQAVQPKDSYTIGGPSDKLTSKDITSNLQKIEEAKREFTSLEITHGGEEPLLLTDDVLVLLKALHPKNIVLRNIKFTNANLDSLESTKQFYVDVEDKVQGKVQHVLTLKDKISQFVLPIDYDEMLDTLTDLSKKNHRIVNLYFTRMVPHHMEQAVADCVDKIKPTTMNLILDAKNRSPQVLGAALKA